MAVKLKTDEPRGILHNNAHTPITGHARYLPSEKLASFVEHYWFVEWNYTGNPPQQVETLPHPAVHLVYEEGKTEIAGVPKKRFSRLLQGKGFVFGIKFTPGGFYGFYKKPVSQITGKVVATGKIFAEGIDDYEKALFQAKNHEEMIVAAEAFLTSQNPASFEDAEKVSAMVYDTMRNRQILNVQQLADTYHITLRSIERLFARYAGVTPKWVIKRYRLHEAADRISREKITDWPALSYALGYYDQAHFIRDFKQVVGLSPDAYAKKLHTHLSK